MSVEVGPAGLVNGCSVYTFSQKALKKSVETLMQHQHARPSAKDKDKALKKHDEEEGFTRSISLYWSWVRGQKAAARLGQGLANNSTALILQCEHWLEAADPKHRYGTNLRPYFDYWLNQQAKARDAASAMHTYISYSTIPEIAQAAQAAAEANNAASCGADTQLTTSDAAAEAGADGQAAAAGNCHPHAVCEPPATPRRSRSAPNLADLNMPPMSPSSAAAAAFAAAVATSAAAAGPGDSAAAAATPEGHRVPALQHFATFSSHESVAGSSSKFAAAAATAEHHQQHEQVWPLRADSSSVALPSAAAQITPAASITLGMTALNSSPNLPGIHTDDRFFYWLDEGAGRHVDLADRGVSRSKLESERVQYLTESERNQLEVTVEPSTGLLIYKVSGHLVHTGSELSLVQRRAGPAAAAGGGGGAAAAGANGGSEQQQQQQGRRPRLSAPANLQLIPESCREEDEDEDEDEQPEDGDEIEANQQEQQQQEGPASEERGRRRQQRAALRQLQQDLRQHSQPMRIDAASTQAQCQHQQQFQPQHAVGSADTDVVMLDADADAAADVTEHACHTPTKSQCAIGKVAISSEAAAVAAEAAGQLLHTPTAAAYGAVAGQSTPGTTCISQRQQSPAVAALQQQQQQQRQQRLHQTPLQLQPPPQQPDQQQQPCQQQQQPNGVAVGVEPAAASVGGGTAAGDGISLLQIKEKPSKWIYVLDTSGRLFVHAKFRGKFHHSSFLQGGAVLSAGGIVVEHGRIMKLTADSGHYRPNFDNFMSTVQLLKDWGADLTQTKLSAKHIKCPQLPEATSS